MAGHLLAKEMPPKVKFHSTKAEPSRQPVWTVLGCLVHSVQNPCLAPTAVRSEVLGQVSLKGADRQNPRVWVTCPYPSTVPPSASLPAPPPSKTHICQQLGPRSYLAFSSHWHPGRRLIAQEHRKSRPKQHGEWLPSPRARRGEEKGIVKLRPCELSGGP